MQQQQIKEAAVVVREYAPGDYRLIAFCVPDSTNCSELNGTSTIPDSESIRSLLKVILPGHMVPSGIVFLDSMPLTPNGKIDRNRLFTKDVDQLLMHQYEAPRNHTEEILIQIWSDILGIDQIGIHDNFFELGGHSFLTVQVIRKINAQFNLNLPVAQFFERATIAQLAELIIEDGISFSGLDSGHVDLVKEAQLNAAIQPQGNLKSYVLRPKEIFLTGATGFLGTFLLHELLQQTSAKVRCLVRAKSEQEAYARLRHGLEQYGVFDPQLMDRIIPMCGDLSSHQLGFSSEQFDELAEKVESIYHNGALVNFVQSYGVMKATNVLGTQEVLRLACTGRIKPVHYISTLSVFGTGTSVSADGFSEDDFLDPNFDSEDGYGQSKWVAEQLVRVASSRGLPVTIHRPATVAGHSVSGAWNTDDFLCRLIRAYSEIQRSVMRCQVEILV
jgi:nucleoside-diphosphate-sugar epimerase/acyl carrier protein